MSSENIMVLREAHRCEPGDVNSVLCTFHTSVSLSLSTSQAPPHPVVLIPRAFSDASALDLSLSSQHMCSYLYLLSIGPCSSIQITPWVVYSNMTRALHHLEQSYINQDYMKASENPRMMTPLCWTFTFLSTIESWDVGRQLIIQGQKMPFLGMQG